MFNKKLTLTKEETVSITGKCGNCRQEAIFKKDAEGNWRCPNCDAIAIYKRE